MRPASGLGCESGCESTTIARDVTIQLPISPGELLDKLTILEIKAARIQDSVKLANVRRELELVRGITAQAIPARDDIAELRAELAAVNEQLWSIEDELRECERAAAFGPRFIELARSVYRTNDRRAAIKRDINSRLGSELVEEKSYAAALST